ncbi:hypothetical protein D9611_013994 [Ephemerocybe angulata]|uniref:Uncharacterized protein n=1 Tax=Ephemerocybe angulata TaxID=980116 RepID=A0A8H5ASC1_9AGAR|nr:hypothetical protein D9611_013994 [Tulosesus angulatus]
MPADFDDEIPELIEHDDVATEVKRVPLTIICGFLGAGKSTLLKRILTEKHGYRIAVIMNEFGDTADIEAKAINISSPDDPNAEGSEEFLELANGCLCCSIKDSGIAAIEKLMEKKGAFDYIILETTGLADPGPIASMFWHNEEFPSGLGSDIALDGVVCVVDALFGQKQMEEEHGTDGLGIGESLRQIAGSDVIVLNKVDLVTADQLSSTEALIKRINPISPIHRTVKGEIELHHILDLNAYAKPPELHETSSTTNASHIHTADCDHPTDGPVKSTHYELRGISSLQVSCPVLTKAQLNSLDAWLRDVLWDNHIPEQTATSGSPAELNVLRCKGAFTTEDGVHHVLQAVRNIYEISELDAAQSLGIPDIGKIVLIGKGLDEPVRRSLEKVLTQ